MPNMVTLLTSNLKNEDINNNHCLTLIFSYMAELLEDEFVIDEEYFHTYVDLLVNISDYVFLIIGEFIAIIMKTGNNDNKIRKSV